MCTNTLAYARPLRTNCRSAPSKLICMISRTCRWAWHSLFEQKSPGGDITSQRSSLQLARTPPSSGPSHSSLRRNTLGQTYRGTLACGITFERTYSCTPPPSQSPPLCSHLFSAHQSSSALTIATMPSLMERTENLTMEFGKRDCYYDNFNRYRCDRNWSTGARVGTGKCSAA